SSRSPNSRSPKKTCAPTARARSPGTRGRARSASSPSFPKPPTARSTRKRCAPAIRPPPQSPRRAKHERPERTERQGAEARMSYIRITEFADRPKTPNGEWYVPESRSGSVRIDRGDAALAPADADAGRMTTTWTGMRIYRGGSDRKGSIVYMLKYPVPFDYVDEFDAWF